MLQTTGRRWLVICVAAALSCGCRSLDKGAEAITPTYALAPPVDGALVDFGVACASAGRHDESGFLLLDRSDEALQWRLALIDSAEQSLDLQ